MAPKSSPLSRRKKFAMFALFEKKTVIDNIQALGPALAILLATLVFSSFITEFTLPRWW